MNPIRKPRHAIVVGLGLALMGASDPAPVDAPPPAAAAVPAQTAPDLTGAPFKGPAEAPIKTAEYSDFRCPACRNIADAFGRYVHHSNDRVAIYYKFFPLDKECHPAASAHPGACLLAYGGVCAQEQNLFWPYHDRVFAEQAQFALTLPDEASVVKLAEDLRLDTKAFRACLTAPQTKARVVADVQEGLRLGVTGTPALFVNGRRVPKTTEFLQYVDEEQKRLGLGGESGTQ
jgi:protein-disulfide isomerase